MSCIGTAGHVDHGKSALVKVLTGIDPDRLAEEKERGMTIDLGFAWLKLPGGREVSIVDVPGHESFIKNMLAGVGGIDVALLVIAADDGVMPQTREHLAILDLLQVQQGVVALTKIDLVDEEWLALVREEVTELLQGTSLAQARIIPVSAYTKQGLPELVTALDALLEEAPGHQNQGRPRLSIDRVFSLTGFGTVVTGTLLDGALKIGQEVEILPQGLKTRIRSLQTHKQQREVVQPGSRVAINLPNIARADVQRGNVVSLPGQLRPTLLFDARIHLLADAPRALAHNTQVDFYSGSQEIAARVRLLDTEELLPGKSGWAQLRLRQPAVIARRDRFILRIPSPSTTIGGGEVIDVQPRYHRRHQVGLLQDLERLALGSAEELVLGALRRRVSSQGVTASVARTPSGHCGYTVEDLAHQCNLASDVTRQTIETLLSEGRICKVGEFWFAHDIWETLVEEAVHVVEEYHRQYPLRSGLPKEEWRARLQLSPKMATELLTVLQAEGRLITGNGDGSEASARTANLLRIPPFAPHFTPEQQQRVEQVLHHFQRQPFMPPGRSEVEQLVGVEVLNALIEQGRIVKMGDGVLFLRETYEDARTRLVDYIRTHGKMTVAEARDLLNTTRKYILPLLEHLDMLRITQRRGDERVLGPHAFR